MLMKRRRALAVLAGATTLVSYPRRTQAAEPLRIATSPIDPAAQPYYALELGFFRDAGIDAQISVMANGPVISSAVAANSVSIGASNLLSIAVAYKRNAPFTIVGSASLYSANDPTSVLMVPVNSPVRTARDLNGKTFGSIGLKSITEYAARLWMDKNGGDSRTAKFLELTMPQTLDALATNRIDAAIVVEPFVTIAKAKRAARTLADAFDAIAPRFLVGVWFTTKTWANANPQLAKQFKAVMARAAEWANTHPEQSGEILLKYSKLDPNIAKTMLRAKYGEKLEHTEMQPMIDVAVRYGALPASFSVEQLIW